MRLCKIKYRNSQGRPCQTPKWYFEIKDLYGVFRRIPGFKDRAATIELGNKVERLVALRAAGAAIDPTLTIWVKQLPPQLWKALERIGAIDSRRFAMSRPIAEILEEFRESLEGRERTKKHVSLVVARATKILAAAGVKSWSDIDPLRVERALCAERDRGRSSQSYNHNLRAVRQLARWAVANGLASEDPLRVLKMLNVRVDRRYERRALEPDEQLKLITETGAGPDRQGVSGLERALLYRMALGTGLRAHELYSLRTMNLGGLESNEPTVTVRAADSKHRREDELPVGKDLARDLAKHVLGRTPWQPLFALKKSWRAAELLRDDFEFARRNDPKDKKDAASDEQEHGKLVVDFHSLRVTFITNLARAGVAPEVVQVLARHTTLQLTYGRYVKRSKHGERRAINVLPDYSGHGDVAQLKTGTGDAPA